MLEIVLMLIASYCALNHDVHMSIQRTAHCHIHFSTEATMLAGDPSGSRTTISTVGQPPTATGPGLLSPSLRDRCVNPGSVLTALSRNGESSGAQEWASVPPPRKFSREDIDSDEGSIDRWTEQFEERAKVMGWNDEQKLFQLKAHLEKTAEHA